MPHPHPRQRLLRELALLGGGALLALGGAAWWAIAPPAATPPPDTVAGAPETPASTATVPAPPAIALWRPLTDAPVAAAAPPPPPSLRLVALSRRDGRWTALLDPGNGAPPQRVVAGDNVAGWQVVTVQDDGVELASGAQRHRLGLGP